MTVYAGGQSKDGDWWEMTPRPDVVIGPKGIVEASLFPSTWRAQRLLPHMVVLPWPDFGIPKVPIEFWKLLADDLRDLAKERKRIKVLCTCMGGHGRTGTALLCLMDMFGQFPNDWDANECVQYLRKLYCDEAVESTKQVDYFSSLTGRKYSTGSVPFKSYGAVGGYNPVSTSKSSFMWEDETDDSLTEISQIRSLQKNGIRLTPRERDIPDKALDTEIKQLESKGIKFSGFSKEDKQMLDELRQLREDGLLYEQGDKELLSELERQYASHVLANQQAEIDSTGRVVI